MRVIEFDLQEALRRHKINREFEDAEREETLLAELGGLRNEVDHKKWCEDWRELLLDLESPPDPPEDDWDFAIMLTLRNGESQIMACCRTIDSCWFIFEPDGEGFSAKLAVNVPKEVGESLLQGLQLALRHCPDD